MRLTALADNRGAQGKWPARTTAQGSSVPSPTEGWDAISNISTMPPKRAVRLINWFPQPGWIELRKGFVTHCDTGSGLPVETLAAYQGVASRKLFAATGTQIFDVTTAGAPVLSTSGYTNARWQFINFATTGGNFLYMVNGADTPIYFDGATWTNATITGMTPTDIIGVDAHKNRLWFNLINSSDAYYLPTDSINGAAVKFPVGGLFTQGGLLTNIGTWTIDAGNGPDDYLVFLSSRGQAAVYSGTDPSSASTWSLTGVFDLGAPIGQRCMTRVGADIAIISVDGVVPLSRAMIFERAAVQKVALTERIQHAMNDAARSYMNNFGWELTSYPRGTRAILNVPISENGTQEQYVMNTLTGAWCRFTGMNANTWELLNDDLFFGGNAGIVYEADTGGADQDQTMRADAMTAYNYFGDQGRQKRWMMCRPNITTDGLASLGLAFNVDFRDDAAISVPTTTATTTALWDVALWDVGMWSGTVNTGSWTSVTGVGYCASIRVVVDIAGPITGLGNITLQVNNFNLTEEVGAWI